MTAHRYWRLWIIELGSGGDPVIAEIGMMTTNGGATVTTGGTPFADSTFGGFPVSQAFDGNAATDWASASNAAQGVGYDFGAGNNKDITEVYIQASASFASQQPLEFIVQSSDDNITYTNRWYGIRDTWAAGNLQRFTKPTAAPFSTHVYWGLAIQAVNHNTWVSIAEWELHSSSGGADLLTGGTARGTQASNPASQAVDDNLATIWSTNDLAGGFGITLTYGTIAAAKCFEIVLTDQFSGGLPAADPAKFDVIYSDDGFAWGVEFSESGVTWSGAGQNTQTFTNPNAVTTETAAVVMAFAGISMIAEEFSFDEHGDVSMALSGIGMKVNVVDPSAEPTLVNFYVF